MGEEQRGVGPEGERGTKDSGRVAEGKAWTKPTEEPSMSLRPDGPPDDAPGNPSAAVDDGGAGADGESHDDDDVELGHDA